MLEENLTVISQQRHRWPARIEINGTESLRKRLTSNRDSDRPVLDSHLETTDVALANHQRSERGMERAIDLQLNRRRGGDGCNPKQKAGEAAKKAVHTVDTEPKPEPKAESKETSNSSPASNDRSEPRTTLRAGFQGSPPA